MADLHVGGLLSGMDIQGTIDKILQVRATNITKLEEKKISLQADVAAWTDIGGVMSNLTDSLYTLRSYDTWNKMTTVVSDSTKLSATATSTAVEGAYNFVITRLAQAHSIASDKAGTLGLSGIDDVLVGTVPGLSAGDQFTIEGQLVTVEAADTLSTLRSKINTAAESMSESVRVYASILDTRLVITRNNTGDTDIGISETTGTPLEHIGIFSSGSVKNQLAASEDASFTVNGALVTRSGNTGLTDVIENVTLNLLGEADASDNLKLTISRNTTEPKTAIQDFITNYNAAVAKLQSYVDINLDDPKKPVVGELQGDTLVGSITYNLRRLVTASKSAYMDATNASYTYNGNTGIMESLEDVGVWTSGKENDISITDETRLDCMLANYYDKVEQLFRGISGGSGYEHGVAEDLYNYSYGVSTSLTGQVDIRKNYIENEIFRYEEKIDKMYTDLDAYEQTLWKQFGAMEEAMSRMQSELSWLTSQFGTGKNG